VKSEAAGAEMGKDEDKDGAENEKQEDSTEVAVGLNKTSSEQTDEPVEPKRPPPPPPPQWGDDPYQVQQQPPTPQGWMGPPPQQYDQHYDGWQPPYYEGQNHGMFLQEELDESLTRENELVGQLDNLTAAVVVMEQREELHVRQLDVLTERVMDVEAQAAEDRNLLTEYEANCTALGMTIATLQEDLEEWQKRCSEFSERYDEDQEKLSELKRSIKEKETEAEDLAIAIENLRLAEKRKEASNFRRKQSKGGLFSWLFGFLVSSNNDDYEEMTREVSMANGFEGTFTLKLIPCNFNSSYRRYMKWLSQHSYVPCNQKEVTSMNSRPSRLRYNRTIRLYPKWWNLATQSLTN
jgi:hypothetical protein